MRDIRECSGAWCGQWVQEAFDFPLRGTMGMTLTFLGCRLFGGGEDRDGGFSIIGEYDPATDELRMLKSYVNLRVWYTGLWNGRYVSGTSTIESWPSVAYGSFEAWPKEEEVRLEEMSAEESPVEPQTRG